jgi:hypothetical protein
MNRPMDDLPERLIESDATTFERRVLGAALQKKPSAAASARMAKALGVTVAAVGTATAASTLAADVAATKATAAVATTSLWPWVSAGVIGLVVAGALVGTRAGRHASEPHPVAPAVTAPLPPVAPPAADVVAEPAPRALAPTQRSRTVTTARDLRDQVAFIDSARTAMSTGGSRRALEILRRYLDRYQTGSFRPEAIALEVEALMKLGREAEARALAARFVAEHRGSLLARRVADVAGLTTP